MGRKEAAKEEIQVKIRKTEEPKKRGEYFQEIKISRND